MGDLLFTIGLARSGKSTFSKTWAEEKPKRVCLTYDSYRKVLSGKVFHQDSEDFVRSTVMLTAKTLISEGYDVLLDDTHTSVLNINKILDYKPDAKAIIFHTSLETCLSRAQQEGRQDLIAPINRMWKNLQGTLMCLAHNLIELSYTEVGPRERFIDTGYWSIKHD